MQQHLLPAETDWKAYMTKFCSFHTCTSSAHLWLDKSMFSDRMPFHDYCNSHYEVETSWKCITCSSSNLKMALIHSLAFLHSLARNLSSLSSSQSSQKVTTDTTKCFVEVAQKSRPICQLDYLSWYIKNV